MISAVLREKALQIDLKESLIVLGKANGAEQGLVGMLSLVGGVVNAAEINEIKRSSPHHEHGLKIGAGGVVLCAVGDLCQIVDLAAVIGQLELADPDGFLLYRCLIGKKVRVEFYVASKTELLLSELGLNR